MTMMPSSSMTARSSPSCFSLPLSCEFSRTLCLCLCLCLFLSSCLCDSIDPLVVYPKPSRSSIPSLGDSRPTSRGHPSPSARRQTIDNRGLGTLSSLKRRRTGSTWFGSVPTSMKSSCTSSRTKKKSLQWVRSSMSVLLLLLLVVLVLIVAEILAVGTVSYASRTKAVRLLAKGTLCTLTNQFPESRRSLPHLPCSRHRLCRRDRVRAVSLCPCLVSARVDSTRVANSRVPSRLGRSIVARRVGAAPCRNSNTTTKRDPSESLRTIETGRAGLGTVRE